ncbi:Phosphoheptose isomerase [bioreactor metagenome]|jgi:D-sedoheptulose 7-phosphate isomerase|uniref:Phosphoheptose isomerase n=1 Tax=bioreactor metagenome TaxID=1076179 RepID=A0A644V2X2_9ZZZZ|nr:D-sedoheptulose 7-phosphate isomerase [uncultured Spirochaetota bacterium]HAP54867.1 phosphoheptose isomerase [Spirochaetaceae bacterium]HOI22583.1 SIS domain-containing protein [Spirochaetales bacterium]
MISIVRDSLNESRNSVESLLGEEHQLLLIEQAGALLAECFASGSRVFSCGNGGSLCDAMHFAEECSGRFRLNRPALPATAIADASHLSCTANDFGWDQVFSRYLEAHGSSGDVLLAISTSGASPNVLAAARTAREKGLKIIALTGKLGSALGKLSDIHIATPAGKFSDHVQELHIIIIHLLVQLVERRLYPGLYK